MKKLLVFLFVSFIMLLINGLFFEYVVSREIPTLLSGLILIVIIMANIGYLRYVVHLLSNLQKLKQSIQPKQNQSKNEKL
jgi:hypothetical protein